MTFNFQKLDIPDVVYIESKVFEDDRGCFVEIYKTSDFKDQGIDLEFVQANYSKSKKGTLRGLHYQMNPEAQGKLISVVAGEIFDVAVDIREGSPYYGKWTACNLDAKKKNMIYIPEGFAHGFCVLSDEAEIIYYCTGVYSPKYERGIIWNDASLGISWPAQKPVLSERDSNLLPLEKADNNFIYQN